MPIEVPKGPEYTSIKMHIIRIDGCVPSTMTRTLQNRVKKDGPLLALQMKRDGRVDTFTFNEYYNNCRYFASAMIELGIPERACINIVAANCPEWFMSFMGTPFPSKF